MLSVSKFLYDFSYFTFHTGTDLPRPTVPGMEISRKWEISRIFPGIQEKIDQANRNTKGSVSAVLVIVKL